MVRDSETIFSVSPEVYVCAAFLLILVPISWLLAWIIAALCHELCHCVAVAHSGKKILHITVGLNGAQIQSEPLSDFEMLLCSLAGPIGALLLLLAGGICPKLAVCVLLQSLYNLLPIYPLDGGRALLSFFNILLKENTAWKLCVVVRAVFLAGLMILGALSAIKWNLGLLPLAMAVLLILRTNKNTLQIKGSESTIVPQ